MKEAEAIQLTMQRGGGFYRAIVAPYGRIAIYRVGKEWIATQQQGVEIHRDKTLAAVVAVLAACLPETLEALERVPVSRVTDNEETALRAEGYHRCPDGTWRQTPSNGSFDGLCNTCESFADTDCLS